MIKILSAISYILFTCIFASAQVQNIMISNVSNPNEPCIAINPKNPKNIIGGANTNSYFYSIDGGYSWQRKTLQSTYGVWGDPVIIFDSSGSAYFFHLSNPGSAGSWIDRIVCQKSTDNGATWSNGTYTGLNGIKNQDKEWAVYNEKTNTIHLVWTQFDKYGSTNPLDSSIILYSKSTDNSASWTKPKRINLVAGTCLDDDNSVGGAMPAIGPNGEIYVTWVGPTGVSFTKSLDDGNTWLTEEINVNKQPGGWVFSVPEIYRCYGMPNISCDLSGGPNHGTIYINWSDQRNGETDTDIFLSKSTDNGQSWTDPIRINNDAPGKQQFFSWVTVDQFTGYLYSVFYDRRNHEDESTDVYLATSTDGGNYWVNTKISESPFKPTKDVFFGDYTNIAAMNGIVRPAWTRLHEGKLSIWTAIIDSLLAGTEEINIFSDALGQNFPNPFSNETYLSFKLRSFSYITLKVYDLQGKLVSTLIDNKKYEPGKYVETITSQELNLQSGTYIAILHSETGTSKRKIIVVNK